LSLQTWERRAQSCRKCPLWKINECKVSFRSKVAEGEGKYLGEFRGPIDILFVGEAPGAAEAITKQPFVGPSGQLLDELLQEGLEPETQYIITNSILCTPYTDATKYEIREPLKEETDACIENLRYLISYVKPKLIVAIGKVASKALAKHFPNHLPLIHPSAILQSSHYDLEYARALSTIRRIQHHLL
jgi:DNA polymerase